MKESTTTPPAPLQPWEVDSIRHLIETGQPLPPPKGSNGGQKRMLKLHQLMGPFSDTLSRQKNFPDAAKKAGFPGDIAECMMGVKAEDLANKPDKRTRYTLSELRKADFPEMLWVVEDFIGRGKVTILSAKPKQKKSFMANQAAYAISTGADMFGPGGKKTRKGKVIYFALEDPPSRIRDRANQAGIEDTDDILYIFRGEFPAIDQPGGFDYLRELIEKEKPALIVIDTISKIYSGKFDENKSDCCVAVFSKIRALADETGTAFLLIHHFKKSFTCSGDPRDDMRGSSSMAGDIDIIAGIYNEGGHHILRMHGNDLKEDIEWVIEFNTRVKLGWSIVGKADDVAMSQTQVDIMEKLEELERATVSQLARRLHKKEPCIRKALQALCHKDKVYKKQERSKTGSKEFVYERK